MPTGIATNGGDSKDYPFLSFYVYLSLSMLSIPTPCPPLVLFYSHPAISPSPSLLLKLYASHFICPCITKSIVAPHDAAAP